MRTVTLSFITRGGWRGLEEPVRIISAGEEVGTLAPGAARKIAPVVAAPPEKVIAPTAEETPFMRELRAKGTRR